jgi:hypothetical protein
MDLLIILFIWAVCSGVEAWDHHRGYVRYP